MLIECDECNELSEAVIRISRATHVVGLRSLYGCEKPPSPCYELCPECFALWMGKRRALRDAKQQEREARK